MVNEHILSQLVNENEIEVFKSMRSDMSTAKALLNDEQFNTFMRAAITEQTILSDASFRRMNAMNQVVSSTKINGRVLQKGYDADGATEDELTAASIGFGKAELNSTKVKALASILDDDKEDNIEKEQFEQTLLTMMGEQVGIDLEALCVFGDTAKTGANAFFAPFDGWLKKATSSAINSTGAGSSAATRHFDLSDGIDAMFDAMIAKLPVAYRSAGLLNRCVIYAPWEVFDAYHNELISRQTPLGDAYQTGRMELKYKNIPVKYAPVLDAADGRTSYGNVPSILTIPEFLWYGVYKDLSVEPDRKVAKEQTDYYYRIRCAAGVQWTDAVITANMTATEAAAVQADNKS